MLINRSRIRQDLVSFSLHDILAITKMMMEMCDLWNIPFFGMLYTHTNTLVHGYMDEDVKNRRLARTPTMVLRSTCITSRDKSWTYQALDVFVGRSP